MKAFVQRDAGQTASVSGFGGVVNGLATGLLDTILCGDATFLLKQLPGESIDLVVTSPPYYLQRHYNMAGMGVGGEKSVENYIESLLEVFDEVVRVVKPTGNIVYNIGDKYIESSLLLVPFRFAIEATKRKDMRLVNNITWVKANPTPRQFNRRLVSSTEPFFHFAKGPDYYYARNLFMTANDGGKVCKPTEKLGASYRIKIDNSKLSKRQKRKAHKALDDVVSEVHERKIHSFRMKIKGIHAEAFGGQEGGRKLQMDKNGFTIIKLHGRAMKRDVINHRVETTPGVNHCAIFPEGIIREVIKMLCPKSGIVLDPYIGSGTTAIAALKEGMHFIGIDIDPSYCELARRRIKLC